MSELYVSLTSWFMLHHSCWEEKICRSYGAYFSATSPKGDVAFFNNDDLRPIELSVRQGPRHCCEVQTNKKTAKHNSRQNKIRFTCKEII